MLPIIVAGSRPAATVLVQRRHFDCDTSVDLHRLLHASITETPRSRVSLASTVLLNPIGSHRMPHAQQPNRHRARRTASHIPSRDFLLWRFSDAGPSRSVRGAVRHRPASENLHMSGPTPHRSTLADAFANLTESCSYQNRSPRFAAVSMLNLLYRKSPVISLPTQSGNSSTRSSRSNSTSAITTPFRMPS